MLFAGKSQKRPDRPRQEKSLYPVLHVAGSLKEYQKELVKKEVASLSELSMVGATFSGVLKEADHFQEELQELFPWAGGLRMDTDTISAAHPHEELLERFRKERVPVLVGTQMVAKGLDFENVTLVGVIAPDLSLYVDDFRAGERTFSLLTQVVGRAGRGDKLGRAVIQTFTPDNDVIRCAARQDYDGFYAQEIELRRLRNDPPFAQRVVVTASGLEEGAVLRCCTRLRRALERDLPKVPGPWQLLGPAPAAVAKVNNRYRYRLTLTGQPDRAFRVMLAYLIKAAQKDKENKGVSVYADVDPYHS